MTNDTRTDSENPTCQDSSFVVSFSRPPPDVKAPPADGEDYSSDVSASSPPPDVKAPPADSENLDGEDYSSDVSASSPPPDVKAPPADNFEGKDSSYPSSTDKSPASANQRGRGLVIAPSVKVPEIGFDKVTKKTKQATELTMRGLTEVTETTTKHLTKHVGAAIQTSEEFYEMTAKGLTKVTKNTTRGLTKVTETTTKQLGTALQQSEEVYEKSPWCWFPRFFVQHFPRLFSLLFCIVLPLWFLIGISAGFGTLLASYEAPHEQEANHAILESRARLNRTFVNITELAQLPVLCYLKYVNETDGANFEQRINEYIIISSNSENRDSANATNMTDPNTTNVDLAYTIGDIVDEREEELYRFMLKCQQEQNGETQAYLDVREENGDSAADSLSFNWNRCWPEEIRDVFGDSIRYFPPDHLIEASRPVQQEAAVETEFVRILKEELSKCLELGGEEDECFEQALQEAIEDTGNICHDNVEGTSWFFFTIMTTVGFGNQTPVTFEGRLLIYIAGIASLILYAAVLGSAGYIITTIFDDFVSRLTFAKFVQHPLVGVLLWGGIWIAWASAIAYGADIWWANRLPDFDADVVDTMWFAFISTSTIGLGDYFLQPEVMFASDALTFSILFLIGFVLLSTFLKKLGDLLFAMLPKRQNSLKTRLKESNLIFWSRWPCFDTQEEKETGDDGSSQQVQQEEMKQQVERVEALKSHLPNRSLPPPMNTMCLEGDKDMAHLLDEEEMILKALLVSIEHRRTEIVNRVSNLDKKSGLDLEGTALPRPFRPHYSQMQLLHKIHETSPMPSSDL